MFYDYILNEKLLGPAEKGIYCSIIFANYFNTYIYNFYNNHYRIRLYPKEIYHVTIMSDNQSTIPPRIIQPYLSGKPITIENPKYKIFKGQTLAVTFESRLLSIRHKHLTKVYKLKHSFPEFIPHISLGKVSEDYDINKLPEFPLKKILIKEENIQRARIVA